MPIINSVSRKLHLKWGHSKASQKQRGEGASGPAAKTPVSAIEALPVTELWIGVMSHLNPFELSEAKLVCRAFRSFASDSQAWRGRAGAAAERAWVAQVNDLPALERQAVMRTLRAAHELNITALKSSYAAFRASIQTVSRLDTIGTTPVVPDIGYVYSEARIRLLDKADASARANNVDAYTQAIAGVDTMSCFMRSAPPSRYASVKKRGDTVAMHEALSRMESHAHYGEYDDMLKAQASAQKWSKTAQHSMPDVGPVVAKGAKNRDLLLPAHKELKEAWYWADRGHPRWAYEHFRKAQSQAKRVKLSIRLERDGKSLPLTAVQAGLEKAREDVGYWSRNGEPRWVLEKAEEGRRYAKQLKTDFMPEDKIRSLYNESFDTGLTKRWESASYWAQRRNPRWAHDSLKEARHFSKQVKKPFDEDKAAQVMTLARSVAR